VTSLPPISPCPSPPFFLSNGFVVHFRARATYCDDARRCFVRQIARAVEFYGRFPLPPPFDALSSARVAGSATGLMTDRQFPQMAVSCPPLALYYMKFYGGGVQARYLYPRFLGAFVGFREVSTRLRLPRPHQCSARCSSHPEAPSLPAPPTRKTPPPFLPCESPGRSALALSTV